MHIRLMFNISTLEASNQHVPMALETDMPRGVRLCLDFGTDRMVCGQP